MNTTLTCIPVNCIYNVNNFIENNTCWKIGCHMDFNETNVLKQTCTAQIHKYYIKLLGDWQIGPLHLPTALTDFAI